MVVEWKIKWIYDEILYEMYNGIVKIIINCFEVYNVFIFKMVVEMIDVFVDVRDD